MSVGLARMMRRLRMSLQMAHREQTMMARMTARVKRAIVDGGGWGQKEVIGIMGAIHTTKYEAEHSTCPLA